MMTAPAPRSKGIRIAVQALLALSLCAATGAIPAQTPTDRIEREIPFAIAIRGGVSLGSYEAGVNWAVLRYLKILRLQAYRQGVSYAELKSTSGASAGSINALMSAISWCIDPDHNDAASSFADSINANLFRDTWLGIGFDDLLPPDDKTNKGYRDDDGLLTRNAFQPAIDKIEKTLGKKIFRPGCHVPLGILVTRVEPLDMNIAGVRVHNQRFLIPVEIQADASGGARLMSCKIHRESLEPGNVIYLQGQPTGDARCPIETSIQSVVDAIEASSAFPIAFGRKTLDYCEQGMAPRETSALSAACPDGFSPATSAFIDGGLFDNIPLGTAKALAEPAEDYVPQRPLWSATARRFNYIYLDPTLRRPLLSTEEAARRETKRIDVQRSEGDSSETYGIRRQLQFLGGAVQTGRDYELYNVLKGGEWTQQLYRHGARLRQAVRRRYPDLPLPPPTSDINAYPMRQCRAAFARLTDTPAGHTAQATLEALQCIRFHLQRLELAYRGLSLPGEQTLSGAEITRLRDTLIDWIAGLATAIKEPQLALSVRLAHRDKLGDRRIMLANRFSPLTGEMLEFFGAFIDRSFREYDYYAGVYDATLRVAYFLCEREEDVDGCLPRRLHDIYLTLDIPSDPKANTVFFYLLNREFPGVLSDDPRWVWAQSTPGSVPDRNMLAIADSLFGQPVAVDELPYETPGMTQFITALRATRFDARHASPFLKRIFSLKGSDELTWYYPLTLRASNRLLALEREERQITGDGEYYGTALAVGAFALHSFMREENITLNQSTAPDLTWQAWLPYEIAVDGRNGGLDLSWEPGVSLNKNWSANLKITPAQFNRYGDQDIWFTHADLFLSYNRHGLLSAVGAGPSISNTWKAWPDAERTNIGAGVYVGLLQNKLRITAGVMSLDREDFPGDNVYVNFGVTDIPGFVYWFSRVF